MDDHIIVGYDGSQASATAARWAATEADATPHEPDHRRLLPGASGRGLRVDWTGCDR